MTTVLVELEFDKSEVTDSDVKEYLHELLDDDNVDWTLEKV
jgi:hypothetical protein